ncbi:MAG: Yip1 family protein [Anaerolineae bacterium]
MATLIDLVDRPKKAFGYVTEHPNSFWLPVILVIIGIVVLSVINLQSSASLVSNRAAAFANFPPGAQPNVGQQAGAKGMGQTGTRTYNRQGASVGQTPEPGQLPQGGFPAGAVSPGGSTSILTPVISIVLLVVSWLLIALLSHFGGKLFGGASHFFATFAVGVWATLPFFLRDLTQIAFQIITKRTILSQGLAFLAPTAVGFQTDSRILSTVLANIDPFAIWFLVLLGIGVAVATKVKGWKAAIIAVVIFAVLVGVRLLPPLFGLTNRIPALG